MRLTSLTLLTAAAVALLAAPTLKFAPPEATTLKKTITSDSKGKATTIEVLLDGEAQDAPEGEAPEFSYESSDKFVIVDEYVKTKGGRPIELKRTYEELGSNSVQTISDGEDKEEIKSDKESGLASKNVLFKWDDKKDEYAISYADGEGDEELLKDLDPDLDFLGFVPEKDVKEGDEWDVDGSAARILMFPGGDLKLKDPKDESDDPDMDKALRENFTGKLTLTHKGTKEEGDAKFLLIEFKGDLKTHGASESEERGNVALDIDLEVTGEALWDTVHNHVHSVTMEGKDKTLYTIGAEIDLDGEHHTFQRKITFEGTAKFTLQTAK